MARNSAPSKFETIGMSILFVVWFVFLYTSNLSMVAFMVVTMISFLLFVCYRVQVERRRRRHQGR